MNSFDIAMALWSLMKREGIRVHGADGITDLPPNLVAAKLVLEYDRIVAERTERLADAEGSPVS